MPASIRVAPGYEEDESGVTIALALLLRVEGALRDVVHVERWVHEIEATLLPLLGAEACRRLESRSGSASEAAHESPRISSSMPPSPAHLLQAGAGRAAWQRPWFMSPRRWARLETQPAVRLRTIRGRTPRAPSSLFMFANNRLMADEVSFSRRRQAAR